MDKNIAEMKKDELADHALAEHGVELDMAKKKDELVAEVTALDAAKAGNAPKASVQPVAAASEYLRHPVNLRVYLSTPELLKRTDMVPCDKDGKSV